MYEPHGSTAPREHAALVLAAAVSVLEPALEEVLGLYGGSDVRVFHSTRTCLNLCRGLLESAASGEPVNPGEGVYMGRWCDRVHTVVVESRVFTSRARGYVATALPDAVRGLQVAMLVGSAGKVVSGEGGRDPVRELATLCTQARDMRLLPVDEPLLWMLASSRAAAHAGAWLEMRARSAADIAPGSLLARVWTQGRTITFCAEPRERVEPSPS